MRRRRDLTRWNRSGLERFTYVDANAIEYLEMLRQRLAERFADPASGECAWLNPSEIVPAAESEPAGESLVERQRRLALRARRLQETYHQDRRDWAWEISRSFARCCHLLGGYADAYANEGYLGTATQWDNLRRLVEMLDYHPAPPASAFTHLAFTCKGDKPVLLRSGFQVKNSPPAGADKVVFETLEDATLDPALNEMRASGWNVSPLTLGGEQAGVREQRYSYVSNREAASLRTLGHQHADKLDALRGGAPFRIRDFEDLDVDQTGIDIDAGRLWRWKAMADYLLNFAPPGDWTVIDDTPLPEIDDSDAQALADLSGNPLPTAVRLKLEIERVQRCLDPSVFRETLYRQLFAPYASELVWVETRWVAPGKPEVVAGPAILVNRREDIAEAVTINRVETDASDEDLLRLDLQPSPLQYHWHEWPKGDIALRYAPRWRKRCWLNGDNVIRTREPHGFSEGALVCWRVGDAWRFAEVEQADRRNMRLRLRRHTPLPAADTELVEAVAISTQTMGAEIDAIGMLIGDTPAIVDLSFGDAVGSPAAEPDKPFTINPPDYSSPPDTSLLPPGGLSFGSFLFPTPLLPVDLVKAAVELMLSMGVMVIPSTGEVVFKSLELLEMPSAADLVNLFDAIDNLTWNSGIVTAAQKTAAVQQMLDDLPVAPAGDPQVRFKEIMEDLEADNPLVAVHRGAQVKAVVVDPQPLYVFEASADKLRSGDRVVGEFSGGPLALEVDAVDILTSGSAGDSFSLSFKDLPPSPGELLRVDADFRGELVAQDHAFNSEEVGADDIELEKLPASLKLGDLLLFTAADKPSVLARIVKIDGARITTDPPVSGLFTLGELVIRGNLVLAGHGERKPAKILGSGDATRSNQVFELPVDSPSFVPDPAMSAGVAAAIDVEVDGRVWQQVSSLKDSRAADHHYTVRVGENGRIRIIFGDGQYGRRLPSGKNNLRVRYRVGSGSAGNLPAHGLEKPVNPHPLVDSVRQYQAASGGGDLESPESLRDNAPASLLALERAVSLSDFTHLAAARSSVWQARAYRERLQHGRLQGISVVIVPAGGVGSDKLRDDLERYLQQHAVPGIRVSVTTFSPQPFRVAATLYVDSEAFFAGAVEDAVSAALTERFALRNRRLGEPIYISEVYQVVESVTGVENSIVVLGGDSELRVVEPRDDRSVVYLDAGAASTPPALTVVSEEYRP